MAKYSVTIRFERTQTILVEADSKDDAIDIVNDGEFDDSQINHTGDGYAEIVGAMCVDAETLIAK